jgi:hypothetical protein
MAKRDLNQSSTARVPDTWNGYTVRIGIREEYMTAVQYYSSRREKVTAKWNKVGLSLSWRSSYGKKSGLKGLRRTETKKRKVLNKPF